ncbi:MAG: hypothetical protein LBP37_00910, partial [Spirochaetaceae bacterium]|nr:hypothetical protein [Spirochaetaceae bacterium]
MAFMKKFAMCGEWFKHISEGLSRGGLKSNPAPRPHTRHHCSYDLCQGKNEYFTNFSPGQVPALLRAHQHTAFIAVCFR